MRRILKIGAAVLAAYVMLAAGMFFGLARPTPPEELWPKPGDLLVSKAEKVEQRILERRGDNLYSELIVLPGAGGPPPHVHQGFTEAFEVTEGILSIEVNGETKTLRAGERFAFEPGVVHKPFNPGTERAVVRGEIPRKFAACLAQLYGFMDSNRGPPPLQIALSFDYCDTHVGPPAVEKVLWAALGPIARLSGLKSYDPEYAAKPAPARLEGSAAAAK
jgi:mannose-6-phosphate isomerase-like protein (cupin superfamily)